MTTLFGGGNIPSTRQTRRVLESFVKDGTFSSDEAKQINKLREAAGKIGGRTQKRVNKQIMAAAKKLKRVPQDAFQNYVGLKISLEKIALPAIKLQAPAAIPDISGHTINFRTKGGESEIYLPQAPFVTIDTTRAMKDMERQTARGNSKVKLGIASTDRKGIRSAGINWPTMYGSGCAVGHLLEAAKTLRPDVPEIQKLNLSKLNDLFVQYGVYQEGTGSIGDWTTAAEILGLDIVPEFTTHHPGSMKGKLQKEIRTIKGQRMSDPGGEAQPYEIEITYGKDAETKNVVKSLDPDFPAPDPEYMSFNEARSPREILSRALSQSDKNTICLVNAATNPSIKIMPDGSIKKSGFQHFCVLTEAVFKNGELRHFNGINNGRAFRSELSTKKFSSWQGPKIHKRHGETTYFKRYNRDPLRKDLTVQTVMTLEADAQQDVHEWVKQSRRASKPSGQREAP